MHQDFLDLLRAFIDRNVRFLIQAFALLTFFPTLDHLRPDPQFAKLRRRIGLS